MNQCLYKFIIFYSNYPLSLIVSLCLLDYYRDYLTCCNYSSFSCFKLFYIYFMIFYHLLILHPQLQQIIQQCFQIIELIFLMWLYSSCMSYLLHLDFNVLSHFFFYLQLHVIAFLHGFFFLLNPRLLDFLLNKYIHFLNVMDFFIFHVFLYVFNFLFKLFCWICCVSF